MLGNYFITALGIVKTPCGVFLWQFQCCLPSSCPTPPSHPARQAGDGISCSTTVKYYEMCYFIFSSPTDRPGSQPEVSASAQPRWAPSPFPRLGKSPGTKSILGKSQEQSWRLFPSPAALSGGGGWGRAQRRSWTWPPLLCPPSENDVSRQPKQVGLGAKPGGCFFAEGH